jgi:hypothetical protein
MLRLHCTILSNLTVYTIITDRPQLPSSHSTCALKGKFPIAAGCMLGQNSSGANGIARTPLEETMAASRMVQFDRN